MDNTIINNQVIEKRALMVGTVINLIMAVSGWLAFYMSGSQALLLDGNFSFIMFLSLLFAIKISAVKSRRTELFPFGQFVYESLYALLKGVMIIGVILVALTDNSAKIIRYFNDGEMTLLNAEVILVYSVFMTFLCFTLAVIYKTLNNRVNYDSTILRAEYSGAIIDGFMSAGVGIALVAISYFNPEGCLVFLNYIGDAILVILLCILLGKGPLILVRDSFIELAGGTIQNQQDKECIEVILRKYLSFNEILLDSYISKTGSNYLIVAYLNTENLGNLSMQKIMAIKQDIVNDLNTSYQNVIFEVVLA